jgi:chromatin segregation and condensation protein Rec8/ScpA/Scc1 (kleisin family)
MDKQTAKPFYFKPPWNILFDVQKLEKIDPWDINISFLLLSFIEEMDKRAEIDFRASGVALDSSASIYLMKSRLLLKLEEPPAPPEPKSDFIPPPLILPLRYELTTTTIRNLLEALDEALQSEKLFTLRAPSKSILPPPPEIVPTLSVYLMEMEEQIERLIHKIHSLVEKNEVVTFSKLVCGLDKLEMIRTFIILLFMAQNGTISLWQEESFQEIVVTLKGGLTVNG